MLLARKITPSKWKKLEGLSSGEIPADAITFDLRTKLNSLSFWECNETPNQDEYPEDIALAMAAAGSHIEGVEIVWFVSDELENDGQEIRHSDGKTPVTDMVERHVDAFHLDGVRLLRIAGKIADSIQRENKHRFTKARVEGLLVEAVKQDRVKLVELNPNIQTRIQQLL